MTRETIPDKFTPLITDNQEKIKVPLFSNAVACGFPSSADKDIEKKLNINDLIIQNPASTFFVKAEGNSMEGANIFSGDILVVDKSILPKKGSIIVAVINGEFTVKRVSLENNKLYLLPENPNHAKILITNDIDFQVWGVVTYIVHKAF